MRMSRNAVFRSITRLTFCVWQRNVPRPAPSVDQRLATKPALGETESATMPAMMVHASWISSNTLMAALTVANVHLRSLTFRLDSKDLRFTSILAWILEKYLLSSPPPLSLSLSLSLSFPFLPPPEMLLLFSSSRTIAFFFLGICRCFWQR